MLKKINRVQDILNLTKYDRIKKEDYLTVIEKSKKYEDPKYCIHNSNQKGINWIGSDIDPTAIIIKATGKYVEDTNKTYGFEIRNGKVDLNLPSNQILQGSKAYNCPVFYFKQQDDEYLVVGVFSIDRIYPTYVTLKEYIPGIGVWEMIEEANSPDIEEMIKDAEQGSDHSKEKLAEYYLKINDYTNAKKWFEAAAKKNNTAAIFQLGLFFYHGYDGNIDFNKAIDCFKLLIKNNTHYTLNAYFWLGNIYYYGNKSFKANLNKAKSYYIKSLGTKSKYKYEDIEVLEKIADIAFLDLSLENNLKIATLCYNELSNLDSPQGYYGMGLLNENKNNFLARKYFIKAADLNHSLAQMKLSKMFLEGIGGDVQINTGLKMIYKAYRNGNEEAFEWFNKKQYLKYSPPLTTLDDYIERMEKLIKS